jgi:biopolymer transport protein ExbD
MTDLSLTSLIDVALTLLVIFMVTAPMMNNAVRVTLPKGTLQEAKGVSEELVIYIDAQNNIVWNGKTVDIKTVIESLVKAIGSRKDQSAVFIRADRAASYGTVFELFEQIRSKGIGHVVLPSTKST